MRHPFIDDFKYKHVAFRIIRVVDKIINFFDHYYVTIDEGDGFFPARDIRPNETGVNGHIEFYTGEERDCMPKYIKTPIVRIVYDNSKWSHWTSDYNRTIPVTISDNPKPLKRHKFKEGELTEEQFNKFLKFIADNKDALLDMWYNGNYHSLIDHDHIFDWHKFKDGKKIEE